jgi:hypothetical protein
VVRLSSHVNWANDWRSPDQSREEGDVPICLASSPVLTIYWEAVSDGGGFVVFNFWPFATFCLILAWYNGGPK